MVLHRYLLVVACLAACKEAADAGPTSFEPTLSARELWSGGELRISEPWFAQADPTIIIGTDTISPTRIDSITFSVALPRKTGKFPIRVVAASLAASLGDVRLHGFESWTYGPVMSGLPYWFPGSAPLVFAGADQGAAVVDLRSATAVITLPESIYSPDCIMSVGPTHRPGRFALMGRKDGVCTNAKVWTVSTHPELHDSIPWGSTTSWYTTGQPADRRWVFNRNNQNYFWNCDTGCTPTSFRSGDGPDGVTISPRGDRFLWWPAYQPIVYDAHTFDTAFVIPGYGGLRGAFSFDGDTLVFTAQDDLARPHLVEVRASDGLVLQDLMLDSGVYPAFFASAGAVAYDPVQPWLYTIVSRWNSADTAYDASLIVLDRTTWTRIAALDIPRDAGFYSSYAIVPNPVEHRIYLVSALHGEKLHGFRSIILRFSTP